MQLDEWDAHAQQGIADCHGSVRVRTRVDDDAVDAAAGGLDAVDQRTFMVGLECVKIAIVMGCDSGTVGFDVGQRCVAVDVWLAGAEEVEVRAVEEED